MRGNFVATLTALNLLILSLATACGTSHTPGSPGPDAGMIGSPSTPAVDGGERTTDPATPTPTEPRACTDDEWWRTPAIYYGTATPTALPLSVGQQHAVGSWNGCSGTFITQEWVLTANHCRVRTGDDFCIGIEPSRPDTCFSVTEVHSHASQDLALARVDAPASSRLPTVEPIAINTFELDSSFIGQTAEAAGYGSQEDGSFNEREFVAEPIVGYEGTQLVIDGMGTRGVCFGDSGGPVMILASDGSVRVAGALSWGDESCLGRDRYDRTDLAVAWIESYTGPTSAGAGGCGSITEEGRCIGNMATWCVDDAIQNESCASCGWDDSASGYRCIAGADPCDGVSAAGECDGTNLVFCDRGTVRRADCGECDQVCLMGSAGGRCAPDPCEGIDYLGACDGDVAVWCEDGELRRRDCSRRGRTCGYVNDEIGYFCQ